jgi:hypothetical protein
MVGVLVKKVSFKPLDPFIGFVTLGMRLKKIENLPKKKLAKSQKAHLLFALLNKFASRQAFFQK